MKTESSIIKIEKDIISEEESLKKLRNEYAKMIYAAFKQKGSRNDSMFVVSSKDFNQAYKRMLYLKQYSIFRKNQAEKIILIKVPSAVYPELRKIFLFLFENSGFKEIKINENVDFENLYKIRKNQ